MNKVNMIMPLILVLVCMFVLVMYVLFYITDEMETHGLRGRRSDYII